MTGTSAVAPTGSVRRGLPLAFTLALAEAGAVLKVLRKAREEKKETEHLEEEACICIRRAFREFVVNMRVNGMTDGRCEEKLRPMIEEAISLFTVGSYPWQAVSKRKEQLKNVNLLLSAPLEEIFGPVQQQTPQTPKKRR